MRINNQVIERMYNLEGKYGSLKSKWLRNYFLSENSMMLSLDSMTDDAVNGFYTNGVFEVEEDTTVAIQENIIKSCISTLVSKIASQKVRPYFNTVNGTFHDIRIVKQAQQFFDILFDDLNMNKVVSDAFKDTCIFGRGIVFVDRDKHNARRIMPWQLYIDPREYSYGHITYCAWKQNQFPTTLLDFDAKTELEYVTKWEYWDLNKSLKATYIPEIEYYKEERWDCNVLPFLIMTYESPVKGTNCQSICDMLMGIQLEINALLVKIKDSSQLSPAMTYFVPEQSTIKTQSLSNRTGEIVTYTATPNMTGSPVTVSTPAFIDPQYIQLLDKFKQDAYELCGISQLSAMSKKPQGLDSGVALSTMEDIESDRFETQLNQIIHAYIDIARIIMAVFPPDDEILPPTKFRSEVTWADIVQASSLMNVQFSAANSLSKDPSTKLQQLQNLYLAGLIPQGRIAQLMDIPDVESAFSVSNNALNAVLTVIHDCIDNDNYGIPDYIPTDKLQDEILNTMMSLKAANRRDNETDIAKLRKLYQISEQKNVDSMTGAEMAAVASLQQEMNTAMQPGGMIDGAIQGAIQQSNIDDAMSASNNNIEGM